MKDKGGVLDSTFTSSTPTPPLKGGDRSNPSSHANLPADTGVLDYTFYHQVPGQAGGVDSLFDRKMYDATNIQASPGGGPSGGGGGDLDSTFTPAFGRK